MAHNVNKTLWEVISFRKLYRPVTDTSCFMGLEEAGRKERRRRRRRRGKERESRKGEGRGRRGGGGRRGSREGDGRQRNRVGGRKGENNGERESKDREKNVKDTNRKRASVQNKLLFLFIQIWFTKKPLPCITNQQKQSENINILPIMYFFLKR